ncbi:MAG TPA: hypothetical protein VG268_04415 [Streptosporangiaceae bacterium]|nr:hypothetical protein [Streptosporangiaceae bacterium]
MRRYLAAAVALAAVLLGPALGAVLAAAPASAANGTSSVGCSTGDSCEVMLEKMVTFGGANYDPGTDNMVVDIAPPPCLWEPIGDGTTGSQAIVNEWGDDPAKAPATYQINVAVKDAHTYLTQPPAPDGTWYELPVNDAAGQAGIQECLQMPLYAFVPPGGTPPGLDIPPATLAQLAVAKMDLPTAGDMTLNPASGHTFTNLPTYLSVALAGNYQPGGMPYTTVTATLNGISATVWGVPSKLKVSASGGGQYTPATTNCGYLGSTQISTPVAQNAGPGTVPDCGATFQSPATWQLTATMTWQACWMPGLVNGPPPANCQPVAGAQLNPVNWARPVFVNEIQSVDNGNG